MLVFFSVVDGKREFCSVWTDSCMRFVTFYR